MSGRIPDCFIGGICCHGCGCNGRPDKLAEGDSICHYCRNPAHYNGVCNQCADIDQNYPLKLVCFDCNICWKAYPPKNLCGHRNSEYYYCDSYRKGYNYLEYHKSLDIEQFNQEKSNCINCKHYNDPNYIYNNPKCRLCANFGQYIGRDFEPPKKKNIKEWELAKQLYNFASNRTINNNFLLWFAAMIQNKEGLDRLPIINMGEEWSKLPYEYCNKAFRFPIKGLKFNEIKELFNNTNKLPKKYQWSYLRQYVKILGIINYWKKRGSRFPLNPLSH
jgi:hypothetical protein